MEIDFQTFHLYNKLVRRGYVKPLTCQHCDGLLVIIIGDGDRPALRCYACSVTVYPGFKMFEDIRAVVKEHFD